MPRLIWSEAALSDVRRLHSFLHAKNRLAAVRAVRALRQGAKLLALHPEIGRPMDDMPLEFRERVIEFGQGGYVAMYHFDGERVVILGIKHGREWGY